MSRCLTRLVIGFVPAGVAMVMTGALVQDAPAQESGRSSAVSSSSITEASFDRITPVTAYVRAAGREKKITFVGRTSDEIVFVDGDSATGQRKRLPVEKVEEVFFDIKIDRVSLHRAVVKRDWLSAVRLLHSPLKPTLPYLDLMNNNAASLAVRLGDYMMRAAEQKRLRAENEEDEEVAGRQYEMAYAVLKQTGKAVWCSEGTIASLKGVKCLLELSKPKTARHYFERVEEPMPGDAAFGLYWLVKAELEVQRNNFRAAMAAAVQSLCFENKDVDTFPDALLLSARCYEEMQQWYRARDVYYEVARIFPRTDWCDVAMARLKFIMKKGLTKEEEQSPIEDVFLGLKEDMNEKVHQLLEGVQSRTDEEEEEDFNEDENYDEDEQEEKEELEE